VPVRNEAAIHLSRAENRLDFSAAARSHEIADLQSLALFPKAGAQSACALVALLELCSAGSVPCEHKSPPSWSLSSCPVALGAAAREGRSPLRSVRCPLVETGISRMPTIGVQRKDGWLFVVSFSGVSFSGLRVVAPAICCRRIRPPRLGNKPYTFRPHHKLTLS
jgi:hypothetical protein